MTLVSNDTGCSEAKKVKSLYVNDQNRNVISRGLKIEALGAKVTWPRKYTLKQIHNECGAIIQWHTLSKGYLPQRMDTDFCHMDTDYLQQLYCKWL